MKRMLRTGTICLIAALACFSVLNTDVVAQTTVPSSFLLNRAEGRAGTWDFFIPITYNPSSSWGGPGGSGVELDDAWGFGFGGGYNLSDNLQLNGYFTWNARDYTATVINSDLSRRQYSNTLYTTTFAVSGIYYFLKGNISPFVSGGVGISYLDTNIQTGPGTTTCWSDPWYGLVCDSTAPTKTESDLSYNAGAGVRFDFTPQFSLQPSYNKMWIDVSKASGTPDFDLWRLDFIWRMP